MRLDMRQGVVSHQPGGFLHMNANGNVDILATNRSTVVATAHHDTNYLHSEDAPVVAAWTGPFSVGDCWLYWQFDLLTFQRTFGKTTLEPIAQSIPPNGNAVNIIQSVAGSNNHGQFVVSGYFVLTAQRPIVVTSSQSNNGMYTIVTSVYNSILGQTTLFVAETIPTTTTNDGDVSLDLDGAGLPLLTEGRMWYDTNDHKHYEYVGGVWIEVLRVFAARLVNGSSFLSHSISGNSTFTGTQIGDTSSTLTGRVLFTENSNVIKRDDRTFLTTEDQFFTNQSRVDAIRLESNVARAKSIEAAIAGFTIVAWVDDGTIGTAQYNHTSTSVVGVLTEDIFLGEVGAVIIQGVVTNPSWNWTGGPTPIPTGSPLWVENGILTASNPHVTDVLTYPTSRVPVARVLGIDTVIFEQGLGGVGDQGPPGSLEALPPANTIDIGAVTLVTPSSDTQRALVISDTDPRLSNARTPTPHTHSATEVLFTPGGNLISNNVQLTLEELGNTKFDKAGGTLTGPITLFSNPINGLHAATKQYVDGLVSGLIWLDPVQLINLISDNIITPPGTPVTSDAYIIPPGAIGDWSAIPAGHVVVWDGSGWLDRGSVTTIDPNGARFGIAMQTTTTASGSFAGSDKLIVVYDTAGNIIQFDTPTTNNAVFVNHTSSLHAFDQFAFSGSEWILFGGASPVTADGVTTVLSTNLLSVKQFSDGGVNDVKFWQGLEPSGLSTMYATLTHTHIGSEVFLTPYTTSVDWGVLASPQDGQLLSTNTQLSVNELFDKKANKRPTYATLSDAPAVGGVEGMSIYVRDEALMYYAAGTWIPIAIDKADLSIPYDIAFSVSGILQQNVVVGSFVSVRTITVPVGAVGSIALARSAPIASDYALSIEHTTGGITTTVGSVTFNIGSTTGIISLPSVLTLIPGDILRLLTDVLVVPDMGLMDVAVTVVGRSISSQV